MVVDDFQPKLGRIRSKSGRRPGRYLNRVIRDMRRAAQPRTRNGRSFFIGNRTGRGYASAAARYARGFQPGRRRVIVKARFTRFRGGSLDAARAHLRYIQRDGVTRDGEAGDLYGPDTDRVDGSAFLDRSEGDRHQFRFIVAPEDGAMLNDLKPFIRDLMGQAEADLGTRLDWVAVDHFNTGHPHSHVVMRGKTDRGDDLVIARDYLSHGFRERARDLITLELGPETERELDQKLDLEVQSKRSTRVDRVLLRDADNGILTLGKSSGTDHKWHARRIARLRKLESMGLADELKPGVWTIAERAETVLRQLGERGDILKTMQRVLKEAGIDRGVADYAVFDASKPNHKITGRIAATGLSDELSDQHYVVVDGTDGKLHYAEIGRLSKFDPPGRHMIATLKSQDDDQSRTQSRRAIARLYIESHIPLRDLPMADGATWLDRKLLSNDAASNRDKGFGTEVGRALRQRQQWLLSEGLMTEENGKLVARRNLLRTLRHRELSRAAQQLQTEIGLNYRSMPQGERPSGKPLKSIALASGRFAVLQKGKEFSLVPWSKVAGRKKTAGITISR